MNGREIDEIMKRWKDDVPSFRKQSIEEHYCVLCPAGGGGNAIAFYVKERETGKDWVIKVLTATNKVRKQRFLDEIECQALWRQINRGIMPIHDWSEEHFWYVMPVCTPIASWICNNSKDPKSRAVLVSMAILSYAETLCALHREKVYHRDIKPENLYVNKNRFWIGDFGLVDSPDSEDDLTKTGDAVGATFTMAPEMRRYPKLSDASKADCYSLAKTLWMLLTGEKLGFAGRYDWSDEIHRLTRFKALEELCLVETEELLHAATSNAPEDRPTMEEFARKIASCAFQLAREISANQVAEWNFLGRQIFNGNLPSYAEFCDGDVIINVLNALARRPAYNHMMLPGSGSLDFDSVSRAKENGCLEMRADKTVHIFKPKRLILRTFNDDALWNYFLLELDVLAPNRHDDESLIGQFLVEEPNGTYGSAKNRVYGVYDYDDPLSKIPPGSRTVTRWQQGVFLIVPKAGPYNHILTTADGRHGQCDAKRFDLYIKWLKEQLLIDRRCNRGCYRDELLKKGKYMVNPFVGLHVQNENISHAPSPDRWINNNWFAMTFSTPVVAASKGNGAPQAAYRFELRGLGDGSIKQLFIKAPFLTATGVLSNAGVSYLVSSADEAEEVVKDLQGQLHKKCSTQGFAESSGIFFWGVIDQVYNHTLKVTKEGLQQVLKDGDDSIDNRLVVTPEGEWRLVSKNSHIQYPVMFEVFCARNGYVGRYAEWSEVDLSRWTKTAELKWADYVNGGKHQVVDFITL